MKTVTIPKRFGYPATEITINGVELAFKSGVEISVEDDVAEAIENAIALAPKIGVPRNRFAQYAEGSITEIIPDDLQGINSIVAYAFAYYNNVKAATIPNGIKSIGSGAFYSCANLESVTIGNSVTDISLNVFDACKELKRVYLPEVPPTLASVNAFANVPTSCIFYCKSKESLNAYKSAPNWSSLTAPYSFVVEESENG